MAQNVSNVSGSRKFIVTFLSMVKFGAQEFSILDYIHRYELNLCTISVDKGIMLSHFSQKRKSIFFRAVHTHP